MVGQEMLLPMTCSLLPCPWCLRDSLRDSPAGPVNTAEAAAAAAAAVDASPATAARRSTTCEPAAGETLVVSEIWSGESETGIAEIGDSPGGFTGPGGLPGGLVWSDVVHEVSALASFRDSPPTCRAVITLTELIHEMSSPAPVLVCRLRGTFSSAFFSCISSFSNSRSTRARVSTLPRGLGLLPCRDCEVLVLKDPPLKDPPLKESVIRSFIFS